jgi:hypothetical protein
MDWRDGLDASAPDLDGVGTKDIVAGTLGIA